MFRLIKRTVVRTLLYPSFLDPPPTLVLLDQSAFRPTGSTSAAIISVHTVINLLQFQPLDFSKALDTVRHSTLLSKLAELHLPTPVYDVDGGWVSHVNFCSGYFVGFRSSIVAAS